MPFPPPLRATDLTAAECVRCDHLRASHRDQQGRCRGRLNWRHAWGRCPCQNFVPPGTTPEAAGQDPGFPHPAQ